MPPRSGLVATVSGRELDIGVRDSFFRAPWADPQRINGRLPAECLNQDLWRELAKVRRETSEY